MHKHWIVFKNESQISKLCVLFLLFFLVSFSSVSGFYCPGGAKQPEPPSEPVDWAKPCEPGYYCPTGTGNQLPCEPGTYNNLSLQIACEPCPAGYQCKGMSLNKDLCTYSNLKFISVVEYIVISAEDLGFDYQAGPVDIVLPTARHCYGVLRSCGDQALSCGVFCI